MEIVYADVRVKPRPSLWADLQYQRSFLHFIAQHESIMLQDVTLKYFVRLAGPSKKNKIECGCERETERTKQKITRRFESKERSLSKQKLVCTNMTLKFHFRVNKPTE